MKRSALFVIVLLALAGCGDPSCAPALSNAPAAPAVSNVPAYSGPGSWNQPVYDPMPYHPPAYHPEGW